MKKKSTPKSISRRTFMGGSIAAGALVTQACQVGSFRVSLNLPGGGEVASVSPNEKLNIGVIGCGGKGESDTESVTSENIVALCDVDERRAAKTFRAHPNANRYTDFREMLEKEKTLDAVIVATPDHTHAPASVMAMKLGLGVYCQKPLTHSIHEARVMRRVAKEYGVATQMGNQGTASNGIRRAAEVIQAGAIGPVREAHVWTNRPVWPNAEAALARITEAKDVPAYLNWELWLAAAPERAFPGYDVMAPFNWRGFRDFGTGALGDMACHTMNLPYMALKLGAPVSVEAETDRRFEETFPAWTVIRYDFPKRGDMPACTLYWHDGKKDGEGKKPPQEVAPDIKFADTGSLLIGDKGMLHSPGDYGTRFQLLPEEDFEGYEGPPETIPRSAGHYKEWIAACKGGPPAMSNFEYSGPLTETVLLGNVAVNVGHKIDWNARGLRVEHCDGAAQFIQRDYRAGYSL